MSKTQRLKGIRGEQEVCALLRPVFPDVERAWEAAKGKGYDLEKTGPFSIQVKRTERGVPAHRVFDVPGLFPLLIQRRNREDWTVTMRAKDFIDLLRKVDGWRP